MLRPLPDAQGTITIREGPHLAVSLEGRGDEYQFNGRTMLLALDSKSLRGAAITEWLPIIAGLLALYVPTFYDLATGAWTRDEHAHGPIILAAIIWLVWDKRQALSAAPTRTAPGPGFTLLVFGLLLYVIGRSFELKSLEVVALVPILAGVLLAMRGWPALRALWFMLLFIGYLVPFSFSFFDYLTLPLKKIVSTTVEQILYAAGYPIAQDGVTLSIGQYQLLVADACSGLNSMISLSAVGLFYLYLMRYKSRLHNGLLLASLLPIAFCANIVRVIILVLVTYHFGDAAGQGFVHGFSGMVLFVTALVAMLLFDAALARILKPGKTSSGNAAEAVVSGKANGPEHDEI